jgi:hypothetical protein
MSQTSPIQQEYETTLALIAKYEREIEEKSKLYLPNRPDLFKIYTSSAIAELETLRKEAAILARKVLMENN